MKIYIQRDIKIDIYICVCVCVCVQREREGGRERLIERGMERD